MYSTLRADDGFLLRIQTFHHTINMLKIFIEQEMVGKTIFFGLT